MMQFCIPVRLTSLDVTDGALSCIPEEWLSITEYDTIEDISTDTVKQSDKYIIFDHYTNMTLDIASANFTIKILEYPVSLEADPRTAIDIVLADVICGDTATLASIEPMLKALNKKAIINLDGSTVCTNDFDSFLSRVDDSYDTVNDIYLIPYGFSPHDIELIKQAVASYTEELPQRWHVAYMDEPVLGTMTNCILLLKDTRCRIYADSLISALGNTAILYPKIGSDQMGVASNRGHITAFDPRGGSSFLGDWLNMNNLGADIPKKQLYHELEVLLTEDIPALLASFTKYPPRHVMTNLSALHVIFNELARRG